MATISNTNLPSSAWTQNNAGSVTSITLNNGVISPYITTSTITSNWNSASPLLSISNDANEVELAESASLVIKGKVIINGDNLEERLERIETLLNIPSRDVTMESKYPKLKKLFEEYMTELSKYKTWDKLKDSK